MTSRFVFLVAASVCAAVITLQPASAQSQMPLRASYQGQFLPEGTEIIVLSQEGRVQRDGRYQPEFISTREFPRTSRGALRRDRLNDTGRSSRSYAGTQESGRLYFIYALTPDSTLYWSYSARRDSLKFDVVSTGVMSVAPISALDVREQILASFFRPRVTVVMSDGRHRVRGRLAGSNEAADLDETGDVAAGLDAAGPMHAVPDSSTLTTEFAPPPAETEVAAQVTPEDTARKMPEVAAREVAEEAVRETSEEAEETAATRAGAPPLVSASPFVRSASAGVTLPPMLAWGLLMLAVAGIAVPTFIASSYHRELKRLRRETLRLRKQAAAADDDGKDQRFAQLKEDFEILHARYVALEKERELQKM